MKLLNFTQNIIPSTEVFQMITYTGTFQIDSRDDKDQKSLIYAYMNILTGMKDSSYLNTEITPGPCNTYQAHRITYQVNILEAVSELLLADSIENTKVSELLRVDSIGNVSKEALQELLLRNWEFTRRFRELLKQEPQNINLLINWESFEIDTIENPLGQPLGSFKIRNTTIYIYIG